MSNSISSIPLSQETTSSSTNKRHWKTARNPQNQPTLNKLLEISTQSRFITNENYKKLFGKAIKSLSQCDEYIETYEDAIKLKGVGKFLAGLIMKKKDGEEGKKGDANSISSKKKDESISKEHHLTPKTASRMLKSCSTISTTSTNTNISKKEITLELVTREANATRSELNLYRTWTCVLLLDNREYYANHVQSKLLQHGIECEQRTLPIGDMLWIARGSNHSSKVGSTVEVILGTIIERKTANDLASSLHGTRYEEQRLRLKNDTIGIDKVIFLIEAKTLKDVTSCPSKTLRSCIESTRIHMNFSILHTESLDHTCTTLKSIHVHIQTKVPNDAPPILHNYTLYQELKLQIELSRERGTKSINAIFAAMLKQIDGMSNAKVKAFLNAYPTPFSFYNDAFRYKNKKEFQDKLSNLSNNDREHYLSRIGDKVAEVIVKVFLTSDGCVVDGCNSSITSYFTSSLNNSNMQNGEESILTVSKNIEVDADTQSATTRNKNSSINNHASKKKQKDMDVIEVD